MILSRLVSYALPVALAAFAGVSAFAWYQTQQLEAIRKESAVIEHELGECGARISNLIEDIESDNAIDNLPDSALTTVPDRWLRVEPGQDSDSE